MLKINTTLIKLNLNNNNICHIGAQSIGEALMTNNALQILYLSYNNITDTGVESIAEALMTNNVLKSLFLENNNITDTGVESIINALKTNNVLNYLSLEDTTNNNLSDNMKSQLKDALLAHARRIFGIINTGVMIKNVSLNFNNMDITDADAEAISNMLKTNTTLIQLNLDNNKIQGEIPQWISNLDSLEILMLSRNQFIGQIPPSIGSLTNLNVLWLYKNQLSGNIPESL